MRHGVRVGVARWLRRWRCGAAAGAVLALIAGACVTVQVVSAPAASAATVPAPAGSWPFSEGSGTTTADSSGNGHTGTLGSGVTWAAPGVGADSIATNGTATAAVTVTGPVVNTAASYTVSAWVYLNSVAAGAQTFVSITGTACPCAAGVISGFYLQYVGNGPDNFGFAVRASDVTGSAVTQVRSPTGTVATHTWYHIVGVYNSVAQTIALYVNGVSEGSTSYTTAWQATGNTMIGQGYYNGATDLTNGRIDDVALYASALTAAQIAALNQPTISAGYSHTCEIISGNAYCWGLNASGELGNNSTVSSSVPVPVLTGGLSAIPTGTILTQISAGDTFTCALSSTGVAYCWGSGSSGALGSNPVLTQSNVPVAVYTGGVLSGLTLTQITAGHSTACVLASTGAAYCWGLGTSGQMGNGGIVNTSAPTAVTMSGLTFTQIDVGKLFVCALSSAGAAYCWGYGVDGELGNSTITSVSTPAAVTVGGSSAILSTTILTQITTGSNFACALSSAGAAYCWGAGNNDQLGNGTSPATQDTAVAVTTTGALSGVILTQVNAGNFFVCALGSTGAAYCWGHGLDGALGNNSTTSSSVPVAVSTSGVLSGVTLTQVSPGGAPFVCALGTSGTAYCWGTNTTGQAGNPDTAVSFLVPVTVALSQPTTVAAGTIHSCEIDNGLAYCWGDNSNGELGNSSTMTSSVPVAVWTGGVLSGVTLTQIATGTNFSCALSAAGAVYCWGLGTSGQLGNNSITSSSTPVPVYTGGALSGLTLTQITANGASACALASTGAAFCWGAGGSGQLGNSLTPTTQDTAVAVTTAGTPLSGLILTGISSGGTSTCALASTGAAYCWGLGTSGQLGNSASSSSSTAVAVTATPGVLAGVTLTGITTGSNFACALASTGVAYCWGLGTSGQLGNSASLTSSTAVAVTTSGALSGVTLTQLEAGSNSSCALSAAGAAYCWGVGAVGQLGNGSTTAIQNAAVVVTATGVLTGLNLTQITVGTTFVCALSNTGAAFCWGENGNGQDGNPATADNFLVPVAVMSQATMVAAGGTHSCLLRNGKAYCWGDDTYGELGNNTTTTTPQTTPVPVYTGGVLSGLTLTQISAGQDWTCALASTGNAYCWGNNSIGASGDVIALGNGTQTASSQPVLVSGGLTFTQISTGNDAACALTSAGVAYCWGNNHNGQIGNSGTSFVVVPTAVTATGVLSGLTLTQIAAGDGFACALSSAGAAYCWGLGSNGQLGNGSTTAAQQTAVAVTATGVLSGLTLTQISLGTSFACALGSAGAAFCWGLDANGQLGNNSTTQSLVPVAVGATATGSPLAEVTAGTSFACAVDITGTAYCWGLDANGQLGNNSTTQSLVPVAVYTGGVLAGASLFQIDSGNTFTCTQATTGAFYCWGLNTTGDLGNGSTTQSIVPVVVLGIIPGAPTGVTATPGDTTATIAWTAPASFGTGTLTGYTATATAASGTFTCSTTSATTCVITGLTDGTTYTVTVVTETTDGNSPPSTAVTVEPVGFLALTSPGSLTWAATKTGSNQSAVDAVAGDQQLTATDNTGTGAGWHITLSATTFTSGTHTLPNAGTAAFTGSTSSPGSTTAPSATCVGTCTLPTDTTTYPVAITTAASAPTSFTIFDTPAATGENSMIIGGSTATNPIGWWLQIPASAYAGSYTSTLTIGIVSAP
jgi:alpha-tubulin suppressor-like RCC1 family protein